MTKDEFNRREDKIVEASIALRTVLVNFMPLSQRRVLTAALRSEEGEGIAEIILRAVTYIRATPKTYETQSTNSKEKMVYLHYFRGSVDAWIVERDVGDTPQDDGMGRQRQAYGLVNLHGDGIKNAEWGYVSIEELIANGVELDLCWEPKPVKELK